MRKYFFNIIPGDADNAACILLYGDIGKGQEVDAAAVVEELISLQKQYVKIDVRINSYGGDVFAGIAICNAIRTSDAEINIYIDGIAASIASVIALCGRPLYMSRYARLMLHQVSGYAYGTAEDMRSAATAAESAQRILAEIIAEKCGVTVEEVTRKYFSGGDHWITAEDALKMGLADSIYDMSDSTDVAKSATSDDIYKITNRLIEPHLNDEKMAIFDELKKMSAFKDAVTEHDVLKRITQLESAASEAEALRATVSGLEEKLNESREMSHKTLVDQAVRDGRIAESQRDTFMRLLDSAEEDTTALLTSLPAKTRIVNVIGKGAASGQDLVNMTWDEIDKANRLVELRNNYPDLYEKKFNETFKK